MDGWEDGIRTCSDRQSAVTLTKCVIFPSFRESAKERKEDVEARVVPSLGLSELFAEPHSLHFQMPRFLQPTSLGDIRRMSLVEETAANQRAIDEWNAASYEAGASGMTIEPGEGISGWSGWGCVQSLQLCVA